MNYERIEELRKTMSMSDIVSVLGLDISVKTLTNLVSAEKSRRLVASVEDESEIVHIISHLIECGISNNGIVEHLRGADFKRMVSELPFSINTLNIQNLISAKKLRSGTNRLSSYGNYTYDDDFISAVKALVDHGLYTEDIANELDCSVTKVYQCYKVYGMRFNKKPKVARDVEDITGNNESLFFKSNKEIIDLCFRAFKIRGFNIQAPV